MQQLKQATSALAVVAVFSLALSACATPGPAGTEDVNVRIENDSRRSLEVGLVAEEETRMLGEIAPGETERFGHRELGAEEGVEHQFVATIDGTERVESAEFLVGVETETLVWRLPENEVLVDETRMECDPRFQPGCTFPHQEGG